MITVIDHAIGWFAPSITFARSIQHHAGASTRRDLDEASADGARDLAGAEQCSRADRRLACARRGRRSLRALGRSMTMSQAQR